MLAFVDVEFDGLLSISGFKIVRGKNGLFVGWPSQQGKDGRWYKTVRCGDEVKRSQIENFIMNAVKSEYQNLQNQGQQQQATQPPSGGFGAPQGGQQQSGGGKQQSGSFDDFTQQSGGQESQGQQGPTSGFDDKPW